VCSLTRATPQARPRGTGWLSNGSAVRKHSIARARRQSLCSGTAAAPPTWSITAKRDRSRGVVSIEAGVLRKAADKFVEVLLGKHTHEGTSP
jgi:hypothetical protein